VQCYHCGEDCDDGIIPFEEKSFCCTGCKLVFELLRDNDLTSYYQIENTPGTKQTETSEFNYLDNEAITKQVLEFQSEKLNRVTFFVPVIHCSACVYLLEQLHKLNPSVIRSEVNFVKKEVSIDYDPLEMTLGQLADLLQALGYTPKVNLEKKKADQQTKTTRELALKIGVAGFCFGNVMLLSFPDYLGLDAINESTFRQFFTWISFGLALPVFFYSGWGYISSAFRSLQQQYMNLDVPIALGMIALMSRSFYEIYSGVGSGYFDSLTGLIFFLLLGKWFQNRTYQFLSFERDYKSYFPLAVNLVTENGTESIPLNDLKVGSRILLRNNEIIPADCELLSQSASIDYSFVTGESEETTRKKGDQLYAGGRLIGSSVEVMTTKEVSRSYLTRLWNHDSFIKDADRFKSLADRISKHFTLTILAIALLAAAYWWYVNPSEMWEVFTAVLIVACPCALALASPFTLGNSLRIMGRNQLYLKNTSVIEKMADLDTIIFDKTGTITLPQKEEIKFIGDLSDDDKLKVSALVRQSSHPLSKRIYEFMEGNKTCDISEFREIPGQGICGFVGEDEVRLGARPFIHSGEQGGALNNQIFVSIKGEVKGHFEVTTSYREGLRALIDQLKDIFRIHLLTGDHSKLEESRITKDFGIDLTLAFNQGPSDKMDYIGQLQASGQKIMMVGDGLNDSGALKKSEVGIAVTDDTSLFTPASDGIIKGEVLPYLAKFMKLASSSRQIVIASFVLSFLYNFVGLGFAVSGQLTPLTAAILMPLSSITVVTFSTVAVNIAGKRLKLI